MTIWSTCENTAAEGWAKAAAAVSRTASSRRAGIRRHQRSTRAALYLDFLHGRRQTLQSRIPGQRHLQHHQAQAQVAQAAPVQAEGPPPRSAQVAPTILASRRRS